MTRDVSETCLAGAVGHMSKVRPELALTPAASTVKGGAKSDHGGGETLDHLAAGRSS